MLPISYAAAILARMKPTRPDHNSRLALMAAILRQLRRTVHCRRRQCDINVGTVIDARIPRVAPPSTNSRIREWP